MKKLLLDWRFVSSIFILTPVAIILIKIVGYHYNLESIIPEKGYKLTLTIDTKNQKPDTIQIKTYAPLNNFKQTVVREQGISDSYTFSLASEGENRRIIWQSHKISGNNKMEYSAVIKSHHIRYIFNEQTKVDTFIPENIRQYLKGSKEIETDSAAIKNQLQKITAGKNSIYEKIRSIHNYIVHDIKYVNYSGILDAESCLTLGEGSCNGKSRLYVAMVQNLGLPARVVGGIILNKSPKKMVHQWVEIYINGQWVPFCPTNNYFAELPKNYVALYYDDHVLFKRTAGIKFDYNYSFESTVLARESMNDNFDDIPLNINNLISQFEKFNLSLDIFIYLLMLPFAALVSVILKNIIGLETFGTFLPILIASVLHNTGVLTGLGVFSGIIFIVYFLNLMISKLDILYHPKMAILLSFVILCLLGTFSLGLSLKIYSLVYVVFFPVAIVAITIHRVIILVEESSFKKLFITSLNTVVVILTAYYFIHSTFLQLIMLSFPEIVLLLIGLNILVGRWAGFRMMEYFRFAQLIKGEV